MNAPETWLALLRVVVGAWFLKAVWTKLVLEFLWGVVPYPVVSERFLAFHPNRVAAFAAAPRQGTFATAIPHGRVPHGTRATTVSERVSITATSFVRPTVAQRNRPSGVSAVHQVRGPTGIALSTFSDAVSRTRISPDWPCDTYARAPSGANVTSTGRLPPVCADLLRSSYSTSITVTT